LQSIAAAWWCKTRSKVICERENLEVSEKSSTFVVGIGDQRLSYFITNVVVSIPPLPAANTTFGLRREP
jgi:hypothetical protein